MVSYGAMVWHEAQKEGCDVYDEANDKQHEKHGHDHNSGESAAIASSTESPPLVN